MPTVLAINCGSSSIRFALYDSAHSLTPDLSRTLHGKIDHIGMPHMALSFKETGQTTVTSRRITTASPEAFLIDWLGERGAINELSAVGLRWTPYLGPLL